MNESYLEVTFRRGKALAAYYYLARGSGARSSRTQSAGKGILVDYAADGRPIGIELTAPALVTLTDVNEVLRSLGCPSIAAEDLAPLAAA